MRQPFITDRFLLTTDTAVELYETYARDEPIIDYHCHLPPGEIAGDIKFENLALVWLAGDHYKWRLMRANGVAERFCTGDASDREKFQAWAATMPCTLGNPIYHWTHLELARIFGIEDVLLGPDTAQTIWEECNRKLATDDFSVRAIMKRINAALACTTEDPADTLEHHGAMARDTTFPVPVLPAFRPDRAMAVEDPGVFNPWVDRLAAAAGMKIASAADLVEAVRKRHRFFDEMGCRISDHGIETAYAEDYTDPEVEAVFSMVRRGAAADPAEVLKFKSAMLYEFAVMDHERDWTQQFHLGALRNVNTRMFEQIGPDTGYDSMGDLEVARPLARFLDRLEREGKLTRTIFYNLNPRDNAPLAALAGCFQDGSTPGKMQFGGAWWFLDSLRGMEAQMCTLADVGLLSRFVGMVTDSRSFLSYPRHEYFRRVLCNMLGADMEAGLLPADMGLVGGMVRDISSRNAVRYFGFEGISVP